MNRKDAVALDRKDVFAKKRNAFSIPKGMIYLDGNSLGVLPKAAVARVKHAVEVEWGRDLITSWNKHGWFHLPQVIGDKIAKLIGGVPGSVIVADTISVNLFKVLSAAVAKRRGRKVILSDSGNFPSDLYVAQGLTQFMADGHVLKVVEPDQVLQSINEDVAVVMVTEVDYRTSHRHDMKAITAKAHENGALMIWDLAHSAGSVPGRLMDVDADFAVGCTYKYLNGGPGAPAFAFVHPRLQKEVMPALVGWWGHAKPFAFAQQFAGAENVTRFQVGTQPMLNMVALDAAMDVWKGVSMEKLHAKAMKQCALFAKLAEERCGKFGISVHGEQDWSQRGSHVCLAHDESYAIMQALISRKVIGDFRAPNLMRFGFTPLYVSYADVYDAVEHLHQVLSKRLWDKPKFKAKAAVT
ncbi:kynureninase [Aestuariivirga litoralis]|uniref:kynureninase n=1 Tax=Aestuariivirga litoralis TaxID=2650924 RepID=UPI0018C4F51E|nr:kynureninase [Aestuariivirga litoralis]MBG1233041.1 kynureninase [Aestuariivirga litoralis]